VKLVCLPAEAASSTAKARACACPSRPRGLVEIDSRKLPGELSAAAGGDRPAEYDLVALAMQEPQYRSLACAAARSVARARYVHVDHNIRRCLPARVPGVTVDACRSCYTDPTVWDRFDRRS